MSAQVRVVALVAAFGLAWVTTPCRGDVNLEWRPAVQSAAVGEIVEVGLYAVSSSTSPQAISVLEVIVAWEPAALELSGLVNNGPYLWLFSAFPNDSAQDGLNDPFSPLPAMPANDGNAWYNARSRFAPNPPATATPEGLLVASFRFQTSRDGVAIIRMPSSSGLLTRTQVWDGVTPGLLVTGTIGEPAVVMIGDVTVPAVSLWGILAMASAIAVMGGFALRRDGRSSHQRFAGIDDRTGTTMREERTK